MIINTIYEELYEQYYSQVDSTFIWGDLSSNISEESTEDNMFILDIININKNPENNKYYLTMDINIHFNNHEEEKGYIKLLFDKLTNWMNFKSFNINQELDMCKIFTNGYNIKSEFDTIEELYSYFRLLVNGYLF